MTKEEALWCVGNSHLHIVADYSATSARCACGETVTKRTDGTWLHRDGKRTCPPYNCECGRRHNEPLTEEDRRRERAAYWV